MPRIVSALSCRFQPVILVLAFVAAIGTIAYAAAERASSWRQHEIRIDGSDEEWRGEELPVKGEHFSLGIVNDGEWLYLCLPTKDLGLRTQIGRMGLVVWLDREGGKKRRFGVHFPVPNPPQAGLPRVPRRDGPAAPPQRAEGETEQVPGQGEIGILGPGKNDAQLVPIGEAGGIEARVGLHDDLTVYEVKLPLMHSAEHPFAPNIEPGQMARLEIETAPLRGGPIAPTVFGQPWGAGWGITVGGRGNRPVVFDPIDVTMNVRLARGPQQ
jgi:hypothetical protein